MAVPAEQIEHANSLVSIMKARMQLMATVMADALAEAQANQPGACGRIAHMLGKARDEHLGQLQGRVA